MSHKHSLKIPIGIKLLFLIFFVLIAALGSYFWIVTHLIVGDKKADIVDYSQTRVSRLRENVLHYFERHEAQLIQYFKSTIHPVLRSETIENIRHNPDIVGLFATRRGLTFAEDIVEPALWVVRPSASDSEDGLSMARLRDAFADYAAARPELFENILGVAVINLSPYLDQMVLGVAKYWRTSRGTMFGALFFRAGDLPRMLMTQPGFRSTIVDYTGEYIAAPDETAVFRRQKTRYAKVIEEMLDDQMDAQTVEGDDAEGDSYLLSFVRIPKTMVYFIHETPLAMLYKPVEVLRLRSIYFVLVVMLVAVLLALLFSKTITGPIQALARAASKVKDGVYNVSLDIRSRDEIGELNQSFGEMTAELERRRIAIEKEIMNLKLIHESSKEISLTHVSRDLIPLVMQRVVELIKLESIVVVYQHASGQVLMDHMGEAPELSAEAGYRFEWTGGENLVDLSDPELAQRMPCLREMAAGGESGAAGAPAFQKGRDRMVALTAEGLCFGFILIRKHPEEGRLTPQDEYLLGAIGTSVSITLRNIELVEETADKARMANELKTAQLVQDTLLPQTVPVIDKISMCGFYQSAGETGGDWWGYFQLKDTLVVMIADATGHGAAAALVTAAARSAVSMVSRIYKGREEEFSPARMLEMMNHALYETTRGTIYMTFFCAAIHVPSGRVRYSNAGHDFPWIYRTRKAADQKPSKKFIESLVLKGHHIGKQADVSFEEKETVLEPGDKFLLYTDGIPELLNKDGEEYGSTRFLRTYVNNVSDSVEGLRDKIVDAAKAFAGDAKQADDLTMVVIEYKG